MLPTDTEYKEALLSMEHPFSIVKAVMQSELMLNCINTIDPAKVSEYQAQYKLLAQIETAITNNKDNN